MADREVERRLALLEKDVREIQTRINQLHEASMTEVVGMLEETRKTIREETDKIRKEMTEREKQRLSFRAQVALAIFSVAFSSVLSTLSAILLLHVH